MTIPAQRLARQLIAKQPLRKPAEVVAWFGAMQAQDYLAALWALGLRTAGANELSIDAAIAEGSVIRTHLFRYTWQYVAREDLRWMLDLVSARVIGSAAARFRELELDLKTLKRCGQLFARALRGGNQFTRAEMGKVLSKGRISAVNRRLLHILGHAELNGVICSGGRQGKQPTFALLDERVPEHRPISREEALARLAVRYFRSRGPATDRDLAWWAGLPLTEARRAIELAGDELESASAGPVRYWSAGPNPRAARSPSACLLPAFDEYLVGYQDRTAVSQPAHYRKVSAATWSLDPAVVLNGQVVGTWRRVLEKRGVSVTVRLFQAIGARDRELLAEATDRYGRFLQSEARLSFQR